MLRYAQRQGLRVDLEVMLRLFLCVAGTWLLCRKQPLPSDEELERQRTLLVQNCPGE